MAADPVHVEVRRGAYADSVALLQVSRDVAAVDGVLAAQVAMATPLNVEVLAGMGFPVPDCSPNDMVVAIRLADDSRLPDALAAVDAALRGGSRGGGSAAEEEAPRTTRSALSRSDASIALVSVPGASAAVEAMDALDAGRDVMVFSDNVPLAQEVALKQTASSHGLLVMGPDCGTAMVGGVGLGFANSMAAGSGPTVGIVAASGTGCQQLMCLLSYAGVTVGAALGVGGRDLSAAVGGLSTREALRRLDADPTIDQILLVSKPPDPGVGAAIDQLTAALATPVTAALLGSRGPDLTTAAELVLDACRVEAPSWPTWSRDTSTRQSRRSGYLRGLFVGGTLCDEAMLLATKRLGPVRSNIPLSPDLALDASLTADTHLMVDFGDDGLTQGRAHPMIDPTLRLEHVARMAADAATGVLLMDVVLGHGAEPDPAALLAPAIEAARRQRDLPVVVACVGTEGDPQGLSRQAEALAAAGAQVFLSNFEATMTALDLVETGT